MSRALNNLVREAIENAGSGVTLVTPFPSASRTVTVTSAAFPTISTAVQLSFILTAAQAGAGNVLDIELEHSPDETNWFSAPDGDHSFAQVVGAPTVPRWRERGFPLLSAFWRINATIAGTSPDYTFQVDAIQIGGGGAPDNTAIIINNSVKLATRNDPVSNSMAIALVAAADERVILHSMVLSGLTGNGGNEVWTVIGNQTIWDGSDILDIPSTGKIIEVKIDLATAIAENVTVTVSADNFTAGVLNIISSRQKVAL